MQMAAAERRIRRVSRPSTGFGPVRQRCGGPTDRPRADDSHFLTRSTCCHAPRTPEMPPRDARGG
jgi:hypothetical protein